MTATPEQSTPAVESISTTEAEAGTEATTTDAGPAETAPGRRNTATDIALIATFAALTAVCSLVAVQVSAAPVPITLQTFAVILAGAVLGSRRGALAILLYLAVGFAGLPIFAQGVGGVATFARPSLGYLLAFPVAAFLVGLVAERVRRAGWPLRTGALVGAGVLATLVIYAAGVPVLSARTSMSFGEALAFNTIFVPFDAIKLILAAVVASSVHRAFPDLLVRR